MTEQRQNMAASKRRTASVMEHSEDKQLTAAWHESEGQAATTILEVDNKGIAGLS